MPVLSRLCVCETGWEGFVDPRLEPAVEEALRELGPESRFLLKAHYLDRITFAQIGMMLEVHESTVSRRISQLTICLRRSVLRILRKRGMSMAAAQEALNTDVRQISVDVRRQLLQTVQSIED